MENINTKEYWDAIYAKEGADTWRKYPATFQFITNIVGRNKTVLELGCGVGILAEQIIKSENTYFGIDISEKAIEIAREYRGITCMNCSVPPIPAIINSKGGGIFDIVIATEFIEHFNDDEIKSIFSEMRRVAHAAIIAVPNNCLSHDECAEHYQKFTRESLDNILSKFWKTIIIINVLEEFGQIRLPTLIAICSGVKNE